MSAWQPIETAPLTGRIVDLWVMPPRSMRRHTFSRAADCKYLDEKWCQYDDELCSYTPIKVQKHWKITHWMPLPEPPK